VNKDKIEHTVLTEMSENRDKDFSHYLPVSSARLKRPIFVLVAPESRTRFVFLEHRKYGGGGRDNGFIFQCDQDTQAEEFLKSQVWSLSPLSDKWFSYSCFYYTKHPKLHVEKSY